MLVMRINFRENITEAKEQIRRLCLELTLGSILLKKFAFYIKMKTIMQKIWNRF